MSQNTTKNALMYFRANRLGVVTLTLCLLYMFIGLPDQIWSIWKSQSVREISLPMYVLLSAQSIGWVLYGYKKKDWFVLIANSFGTVFSATIVVEYIVFFH